MTSRKPRDPFSDPYPDLTAEVERQLDAPFSPEEDQLAPSRLERWFANGCDYTTLTLSSPGIESQLSRYLAAKFNHNTTAYDTAIDAVYNTTRIGGSQLHHNLDGSHSWVGAINALRQQFPDDSQLQLSYRALVHLAKDATTPSGINPFLEPAQFVHAKEYLQTDVGLSAKTANDVLNINAVEICAATAGAIAVILELRHDQVDRLAELTGRLALSGFIASNALLLLLTSACLGRICYALWNGDSIRETCKGALLGVVSAGTFLSVSALCSPAVLVGAVAGLAAMLAVREGLRGALASLEADIDEMLHAQFARYRSLDALL